MRGMKLIRKHQFISGGYIPHKPNLQTFLNIAIFMMHIKVNVTNGIGILSEFGIRLVFKDLGTIDRM